MVKMIALLFKKTKILKLPKSVTSPPLEWRHSLTGERNGLTDHRIINKLEASVEEVPPFSVFQLQQLLW
jgi:hypothetical protein